MSLRVTTSHVEPDIVVFHLAGSLIVCPEASALESHFQDLLDQKIRKLVFDRARVCEIDMAAICF